MKVRDLIAHLQQMYTPDEEVAYHLWGIDDVDFCIDGFIDTCRVSEDTTLTKEDKESIISSFESHLDSEYGLTWIGLEDEIMKFIEDVYPNWVIR